MNHLNHLLGIFPWEQYPQIRPNQERALEIVEKQQGSVTLQLPVGSGKTVINWVILEALNRANETPLFYIAPTKTLVEQVQALHPNVKVVYGRNEYPCLYYQDKDFRADEVACSFLKDCPHRVGQETGEIFVAGSLLCPYLAQKYEAKQGGIVVCTTAFYLFTQIFSKEWPTPVGLVIDEAHRIARTIRDCLSFEITDWHLGRAVELLKRVDVVAANQLHEFLQSMIVICRLKPAYKPTLLEAHEIRELMGILMKIDSDELQKKVGEAVASRIIDPVAEREALKHLEVLVRDVSRYLRSFEYSLPTPLHYPLNYTYAFFKKELGGRERVQHKLCIKGYYVAPIIQKLLAPITIACSATIGDSDVFGFETGIKFPFYSFPSDFPVANTRIFMPVDTPNLAVKQRKRGQPTRTLRQIAKICKKFAEAGHRSLVVVVSDKERQKFLQLCNEEGVVALSYGNGLKPKDTALRFKAGEGEVLVGTVANYGEGVDLPKQIAPIIFFLRPGFPRPDDPGTIFEERRFGRLRWSLWNWRVMIEALQVRGRNIRSSEDLGVTFFISQQFRRFLYGSLPEWLKDAYKGDLKLEECVKETLDLLRK